MWVASFEPLTGSKVLLGHASTPEDAMKLVLELVGSGGDVSFRTIPGIRWRRRGQDGAESYFRRVERTRDRVAVWLVVEHVASLSAQVRALQRSRG